MSTKDNSKESVLYVDDEQENLTGFKYSFMFDFEVHTAITVEDAYKILEKENIKVVVSDQRMPELTGVEFLKDLSVKYPDIIRIMLTAYSDVNVALEAINEGKVYQYLTKPWNKEDMKIHLKTAIEAYNLKVENRKLIEELKANNEELLATNNALQYEVESHRKTLLSLERSEKKFKNIFESSQDGIIILNDGNLIIEANPSFLTLLGKNKKEVQKTRFQTYLDNPERFENMLFNNLDSESGLLEANFLTTNGSCIPAELNFKQIDYNGELAYLAIIRDISERKQMEQKMFNAILDAEENERKRIAEELKDDTSPFYSKLRMHLNLLYEKNSTPEQQRILEDIKELMGESISSIREISNVLSPQILNSHGLAIALSTITEQASRFLDIHYLTDISKVRFPTTIEIIYYRLIRELLNFSIKKTMARNVFLKLFYKDSVLKLSFSDDSSDALEVLNKEDFLLTILGKVKTVGGEYSLTNTALGGIAFTLSVHTLCFDEVEAV